MMTQSRAKKLLVGWGARVDLQWRKLTYRAPCISACDACPVAPTLSADCCEEQRVVGSGADRFRSTCRVQDVSGKRIAEISGLFRTVPSARCEQQLRSKTGLRNSSSSRGNAARALASEGARLCARNSR